MTARRRPSLDTHTSPEPSATPVQDRFMVGPGLERLGGVPWSADQFRALGELATAVARGRSAVEVARVLADRTRELLAASLVALYVWDESVRLLQPIYHTDGGLNHADAAVAPGEGVAGQVLERHEAILVPDYPNWEHAHRVFGRLGCCSVAAAPLVAGDKIIAVLIAGFRTRVDDSAVVDVLASLAEVATAPLEAVQLREQQAWDETRDRSYARILRALTGYASEERVLWVTAREVARLLRAPFARVLLRDDADGDLVCVAAEGFLEPNPIGQRLPPESVSGHAVSSGLLNLGDAPAHPAWQRRTGVRHGLRSYLATPIQRAGAALGVLTVMREWEPFTREAESIITQVADAAALAIDTARLRARDRQLAEELAEQTERSRVLFQHAPGPALALDVDDQIIDANATWRRTYGDPPARGGDAQPLEVAAAPYTRVPILVGSRHAGAYAFVEDSTRPAGDETAVELVLKQQAALSELLHWTVAGSHPNELIQACVNVLTSRLGADLGMVLELDASNQSLRVRAAAGIGAEALENLEFAATAAGSAVDRASAERGYVVVGVRPKNDRAPTTATRFGLPQRLAAQGLLSSVSSVIWQGEQPFGILAAHATRPSAFGPADSAFLSSMAAVLSLALAQLGSGERLALLSEQTTLLFDQLPSPVARIDPGLRFTYVNPTLERVVSRPSTDLLGASYRDMGVPDQLVDALGERLQHAFRSRRSQTWTLSVPMAGASVEYEVLLIPELNRDGSVASVLAVGRDLTEQRRLEQLQRDHQQQLLQLESRLQELLQRLLLAQDEQQRRRAELDNLEPLSNREREVLRLLAAGHTNAEMARQLGVSPGTIKNHIAHILPKLGAVDRTHAAARGVELGLTGL
jgi:DNA-binding CsgD family transcriptional regulator/GAF domain-containing protein